MKHAKTIAVDLGKSVFELEVPDSTGHIPERRRRSRAACRKFMDGLSPSLVSMAERRWLGCVANVAIVPHAPWQINLLDASGR